MCKTETPPGTGRVHHRTTPSNNNNDKPARKTRTRTRRPKFLSLRLKLSPDSSPSQNTLHHHHQRYCRSQLHLFPLHPDNNTDIQEDSNVARFFNADDGGGGATTTLTGLLDGGDGGGDVVSDQQQYVLPSSATTDREEDSRSPTSLSYAYCEAQDSEEGGGGGGQRSLVKAALRRRRRSSEVEERWVSYCEVVEKKEEEVSSCYADIRYHSHLDQDHGQQSRRLSLKLDYEEIMNAWSDKGPLYVVQTEAAQTVPDVSDEFLCHGAANVWMDGWGSNCIGGGKEEGVWRVPEKDEENNRESLGDDDDDDEGLKRKRKKKKMMMMGQRHASVLRYKEKRQNRLFSKRIRYEVRKLNAEKRPRFKGRFVKRS